LNDDDADDDAWGPNSTLDLKEPDDSALLTCPWNKEGNTYRSSLHQKNLFYFILFGNRKGYVDLAREGQTQLDIIHKRHGRVQLWSLFFKPHAYIPPLRERLSWTKNL
jgi:hypothetical protein